MQSIYGWREGGAVFVLSRWVTLSVGGGQSADKLICCLVLGMENMYQFSKGGAQTKIHGGVIYPHESLLKGESNIVGNTAL